MHLTAIMSDARGNAVLSIDPTVDSCWCCSHEGSERNVVKIDDSCEELCARCKFLREVGRQGVHEGILNGNELYWWSHESRWSELYCNCEKSDPYEIARLEVFTLPGLSSSSSSSSSLCLNACSQLNFLPGSPKPFLEFPEKALLGSTDSPQTRANVQYWLDLCQHSHSTCVQKPSKLPKRVLDVSSSQVRLCEPNDGSDSYVCLSHCWGGVEPVCRTTSRTIESNKSSIDWGTMPATFRDAITFTRCLGLKYLWIDSMCIIQDDSRDWAEQSASMAIIYENAYLTICATASATDNGGMYSVIPRNLSPRKLRVVTAFGTAYEVYVRFDLQRQHFSHWGDVADGPSSRWFPLLTRAWTYQERLLSRRLVHFARGEVMWECSELSACQCCQRDLAKQSPYMHDKSKRSYREVICGNDPRLVEDYWNGVVAAYSGQHLTQDKDKLPALSGVVKQMLSVRQGDEYLAGLWKNTIIRNLRWTVYHSKGTRRPPKSRCPTWSWASIDGQVYLDHGLGAGKIDIRNYARCKDVSIIPASADPTGEVASGYIVLDAPVIFARLVIKEKGTSFLRWYLVANNMEVNFLPDCESDFENGSLATGDMLLCLRLSEWSYGYGETVRSTGDMCLVLKQRGADGTTPLYERVGWFHDDKLELERLWFTSGTDNKLIKIV